MPCCVPVEPFFLFNFTSHVSQTSWVSHCIFYAHPDFHSPFLSFFSRFLHHRHAGCFLFQFNHLDDATIFCIQSYLCCLTVLDLLSAAVSCNCSMHHRRPSPTAFTSDKPELTRSPLVLTSTQISAVLFIQSSPQVSLLHHIYTTHLHCPLKLRWHHDGV